VRPIPWLALVSAVALAVLGTACTSALLRGGSQSSPTTVSATTDVAKPRRDRIQALSVAFFDTRRGVLGWTDSAIARGGISVTTTGGRTWREVRQMRGSPYAIATQEDSAWALVGNGQGGRARLWRSRDRGATWRRIGPVPVDAVAFTDDDHGYGVSGEASSDGRPGPIYRTADGGRTWTRAARPCPAGAPDTRAVAFVSASTGWVSCTGGAGGAWGAKAIARTTDGGGTWSVVAAGYLPPGSPHDVGRLDPYGQGGDLAFAEDGAGLLMTGRGAQYRSEDAGVTWHAMRPFAPDTDFGSSPTFVTSRIAYLVTLSIEGWRSALWRTDDAGRTWRVVAGFGTCSPTRRRSCEVGVTGR
jgi:photosystem II stability/assembly factor-like uncharacterized protein